MKILSAGVIFFVWVHFPSNVNAQKENVDLDKVRTESGIDPTRVRTRMDYKILINDKTSDDGKITNRLGLNIGANKWSFAAKYDYIMKTPEIPGTGFQSGFGDLKFSILNAFYADSKNALAGGVEFSLPAGKDGFGNQYFSATLAVTYSYTINPTLFVAVLPQYAFDLMKDPLNADLSLLTFRFYGAKFTPKGYFFVLEPRPIINLETGEFEFILSPIIGKALGGGFNFIVLAELPASKSDYENKGALYQLGFNKSF
jgi:hypothetical protein